MPALNPLSDFWKSLKDGHRLTEFQAKTLKNVSFIESIDKEFAIADENGTKILLGETGATENVVDRINGIWHVQHNFPYKITSVRDRDMVLTEKLNRVENTLFEFWYAKAVGYNCFGPFITKGDNYDYIVAKYETDYGPRWGYGKTLEEARAFLGVKLYDEYKDIIHRIACRKRIINK